MAQRWRDKLRPASFRGVRFKVDEIQIKGGRRGPDWEFPDRDEPFAEDTGRKQRKYPVKAYLVGQDYFAGRNKLIEALEKKGSADLVHPYYGKKKVVCRDFTVSEKAGEGGFVSFDIDFVEAGSLQFPKTGSDRAFLVGLAGSLLGEAAANTLTDAFSVADQAEFVVDSATDKVFAITAQMDSIAASITSAGDPLAEFGFALRNLQASAFELVLSPVALAKNLADTFSLLFAAGSPEAQFNSSRRFFAFGDDDPVIPNTTSTRAQQRANTTSLNMFSQTQAVIGAANAAVNTSYKSVDDATEAQTLMGDQLDKLMLATEDDDLYTALQNMRAAVVNAIPGDDQSLAQVSELSLPATMPSLVLAYELYGNVDEEQDLIDRNNVRHPGFVQGGKTLEVLSSG